LSLSEFARPGLSTPQLSIRSCRGLKRFSLHFESAKPTLVHH